MGQLISDNDEAFIKDTLEEAAGIADEPALIKFQTGETVGNPAHGIARTFIYTVRSTRIIVESVSPQDIMYSGGIYQVGDVQAQLTEELKGENEGRPGDRVIYRNDEYRVVGKTQPGVLLGADLFFSYALRKVGKA